MQSERQTTTNSFHEYHLNISQIQNELYIIPNNIIDNTINTTYNSDDTIDNAVDNLILAHFLSTYNINSIGELNPTSIQNPLDRTLYDLIMQELETNVTLQPSFTEPIVEHIDILPTDNVCSDCNICYESLETIDKVELNCGHQMCKSCITECLKKKNTCPFCRIVITKIIHKQIEIEPVY